MYLRGIVRTGDDQAQGYHDQAQGYRSDPERGDVVTARRLSKKGFTKIWVKN